MPSGTEGTTCPYCGRTSGHPTDRAKGWCAACERFYPEGEGPANAAEYRRFTNRKRCLLARAVLTPDERVERDRLIGQCQAWIEQHEPESAVPEIDALIVEAQRLLAWHLKEEEN